MFAQIQMPSPVQHLAMSLHLGRWKNGNLMIGTAYFDASGKKESQVLVVAGFLSPIYQWLKFERDWKFCLAWYGVSALHMKYYAHSAGDFESWKGNESLRKRFLGDLIRIIKDHVDNSFAVAVHMQDYEEADVQYCLREWAHPYALAGAHCIGMVKAWAEKFDHNFSLLDYVFENGDEGKGNLFDLSSRHLSIDPIFKPKEWSVAFQAADLIAYEHYKANLKILEAGDGLVGVEDLRAPFQSLVSIPGSLQWAVMRTPEIVENCQRYGVSLRSI